MLSIDTIKQTVLNSCVSPWERRGEILVAADSNVTPMKPEKSLEEMGLVVSFGFKYASHKFPISRLKSREFTCKVCCCGLVSKHMNEVPKMMDFSWVDHDRW